ncbi:MAG: 50S ribosomal protein L11 methyltransferase [Cephaloticoccus sp.]|nr:50S ribosomal protein L11 methyltransferase [Cephaloticoccus sp.]MCF7758941.1 50S ribosomal protein L11 methyltransferase [Cephaloticoccus sp.]
MQLVEIKAEIPLSAVESIDGILLETENVGWNIVEDVIEHRAWIVGMFSDGDEARIQWGKLMPQTANYGLGEPVFRTVVEQEWRDSYKTHFKAWQFGHLHWVPIWERGSFQLPMGHEVLWLDPGMAFGTGNHETTRLCVERLVEWVQTKGHQARVLDAGCGSGILALSASKLGFTQVCGFDNDEEAVRVSCENAQQNGLLGRVDFYQGDLITGLNGRQAELVLANILADVLMHHAHELVASVAVGGQLVLSGILAVENPKVAEVFSTIAPNWAMESHVLGEWSDLVLKRSDQMI